MLCSRRRTGGGYGRVLGMNLTTVCNGKGNASGEEFKKGKDQQLDKYEVHSYDVQFITIVFLPYPCQYQQSKRHSQTSQKGWRRHPLSTSLKSCVESRKFTTHPTFNQVGTLLWKHFCLEGWTAHSRKGLQQAKSFKTGGQQRRRGFFEVSLSCLHVCLVCIYIFQLLDFVCVLQGSPCGAAKQSRSQLATSLIRPQPAGNVYYTTKQCWVGTRRLSPAQELRRTFDSSNDSSFQQGKGWMPHLPHSLASSTTLQLPPS